MKEKEGKGFKDFCARYGQNRKLQSRFNFAIKAEIPGGEDFINLLELVSHMRQRAAGPEMFGKLKAIEDRLQIIRDAMIADIRERWEL